MTPNQSLPSELREKKIEDLADWYHDRLNEFVLHPQALREVIKKSYQQWLKDGKEGKV